MSEREAGNVVLRILRRDGPDAPCRWEEFAVPRRPRMNVIACLMAIEREPVTRQGVATSPVAYQANCLEEVCGSCTMLINDTPRQACATLVDELAEPIVLRPLVKFPVIRDLVIDRAAMFALLARVRAWIPLDGMHDLGPGPVVAEEDRMFSYQLSRCMTCGCCMEGCPQYNPRSKFMGPAPLAQVYLFNNHPTGAMLAHERLGQLLAPGGIADCGNTQNCVKLCPKDVPLTDAIGRLGWQTTRELFRRLFGH